MSLLDEGLENPETGEVETLGTAPTMFRAAQLIGRAIRQVDDRRWPALEEAKLPFDVSFLFGGQIQGGPAAALHRSMPQATSSNVRQDAPFLKIGEHKYGKPILDRAVNFTTDLYDALKIGLISMDSTMRSNLGVGPADRSRRDPPRRARCRTGPSHRGRASPISTICASDGRRLCAPPTRRSHARPTAPIATGTDEGACRHCQSFWRRTSGVPRTLLMSRLSSDIDRHQGQVLPRDRRCGEGRDLGDVIGRSDLDHVHAGEGESA